MSNLIDSLDEADAPGWRPNPGDKVAGTISGISHRTSDYGQGDYPIITLRTAAGPVAIHCFHTVLKNEIAGVAPQLGDELAVKYEGLKQPKNGAGKGYESYRVAHRSLRGVDWSGQANAARNEATSAGIPTQAAAPPWATSSAGRDADEPF